MPSEYHSLRAEIDNIKEDIKEIKNDTKENNRYFREVIDTLKENSIRQTEILKNQEKNQEQRFTQLNIDITEIKNDIDNNLKTNTKWYQDFFSDNFGLTIKFLIILVLAMFGVKVAGINISGLFK